MVRVRHEAHRASHGKDARGKGSWVFAASKHPGPDDMFFCEGQVSVAEGAKQARAHFGVSEVWVMP